MADRATQGGGTATDISFMTRVVNGVKYIVTGAGPEAWFGPSQPIQPAAQEQAQGRAFDYPVGYNINLQPRSHEPVTFQQMRALADGYDLLRLVIETVKDQIDTQEWVIKPRDPKAKPDKRCDEVKAFLAFPDQEHDHATWLRMLLEDMIVIDAATIYARRTRGGGLYALEIMDGATIKRLINADGRTPLPPSPAYQQVLKGIPAVDYSRDELLYRPRNVRSNRVYGYSPVEQVIMTVNIALRRQLHQLEYYTEGNTPDLIFGVPASWQPDQIRQFQMWWDTLINDTAARRKGRFIPGDIKPYDTKPAALKDEYDEWLARVICFCFGISPQPFVKEMNRATAGTASEAAKEEGKGPRMLWVKRLHDFILAKYFGYADLEFSWEEATDVDPLIQAQVDEIYLTNYVVSADEVRARLGMEGAAPEKPEPPPMIGEDGNGNDSGDSGNTGDIQSGDGKDNPKTEKGKDVEKNISPPDVTRLKKKAMTPINRDRPSITKLRNRTKRSVSGFLSEQAGKVASDLSDIMGTAERVERDEVDAILSQINMDWAKLADILQPEIERAVHDGWKTAAKQIDFTPPDDITDLLNERSLAYSQARSAELVGMRRVGEMFVPNPDARYAITDSTRQMLRGTVAQAIEEGWSADKLASAVQDAHAFSPERSEMIARTEIAFADVAGNMEAYKSSGMVEGKEWIVANEGDAGVCDECELNGAAGVIGLNESFPDGSDAPPGHPGCRCDCLPVLIEREE